MNEATRHVPSVADPAPPALDGELAPDPADAAAICRALDYPYRRHPGSFVLLGERILDLVPQPGLDWRATPTGPEQRPLGALVAAAGLEPGWLDRLVPVLASGSNGAPEQLQRKFAGRPETLILGIDGWMSGLVSIHSAHIARYGAVTATLAPESAATTRAVLTLIPEPLLARMHETEALGLNYDFAHVPGRFAVARPGWEAGGAPSLGTLPDRPWAYLSLAGALDLGQGPLRLAELPAEGSALPALDQRGVQAALAAALGHGGMPVERFVLENLRDEALRVVRVTEMRRRLARPVTLTP